MFITLGLFVTNAYAFTSFPHRLSGADRYATAAAIAQDGWTQSDYAVLAYGENYPDALSAAPLAKKYDAPILLTGSNSLPDATKQTLIILQVKNAFIIGGTGIITSAVEDELKAMNITPTRIAGSDRYDTAVQVANQLVSPSEVFVTTGEDYPDALSIAPIAAIKQEPVILVHKDYMPDSVKAYVASHNITKTYIIGDTDIIDDRVVNQFPNAERIKGVDRYVRNINANIKFSTLFASKDISVATGEGFADALTGTAYAAKKGIPIVLVNGYPPAFTRLYTVINLNMANSVNGTPYVFGGTGVVSDKAVSYLYTLASSDQQDQPSQSSKPSVPTNIVATAISSSTIFVKWNQVENVDGYRLYYSGIKDGQYNLFINSLGSSLLQWNASLPCIITGIPSNTTVYFKMTSVKDNIESDFSNIAYATTFNADTPPITPTPITPTTPIIAPLPTSSDVIESRIDGDFEGWTGETIFKLQNGQIWQQSSYNYWYHYAYSPKVLIYKSGTGYKMQLDGYDRTISVIRLK